MKRNPTILCALAALTLASCIDYTPVREQSEPLFSISGIAYPTSVRADVCTAVRREVSRRARSEGKTLKGISGYEFGEIVWKPVPGCYRTLVFCKANIENWSGREIICTVTTDRRQKKWTCVSVIPVHYTDEFKESIRQQDEWLYERTLAKQVSFTELEGLSK